MKRSLLGVATAAVVLLVTGAGIAGGEQILVKTRLIYATMGPSRGETFPMKESDPLYAQLAKLFRFKNYGILAAPVSTVVPGHEADIGLWEDMVLELEPEIVDGKSIQLTLTWGRRNFTKEGKEIFQPILHTTIVSADGATTLLGGKRFEEGALILAITPIIRK